MDSDYEKDAGYWCCTFNPDGGLYCTKRKRHSGEHVAHNGMNGTWICRWFDGDTVSVKAGIQSAAGTIGPVSPPALPSTIYRIKGAFDEKPTAKQLNETLDVAAKALTALRDLAHDLFLRMREWRMTSCTIQQQREFEDVMRMLKKEFMK